MTCLINQINQIKEIKEKEIEEGSLEKEMTCFINQIKEIKEGSLEKEMINQIKEIKEGGYIYLIKAESEPPRYKIGMSKNVHKRYKQLKECCPFPLRLIKYIKVKDMRVEEKILHEKMDKYRVWGEWFILPYHLIISINDWFIPYLSISPISSMKSSRIEKIEKINYDELPM